MIAVGDRLQGAFGAEVGTKVGQARRCDQLEAARAPVDAVAVGIEVLSREKGSGAFRHPVLTFFDIFSSDPVLLADYLQQQGVSPDEVNHALRACRGADVVKGRTQLENL